MVSTTTNLPCCPSAAATPSIDLGSSGLGSVDFSYAHSVVGGDEADCLFQLEFVLFLGSTHVATFNKPRKPLLSSKSIMGTLARALSTHSGDSNVTHPKKDGG